MNGGFCSNMKHGLESSQKEFRQDIERNEGFAYTNIVIIKT